MKVLDATFLADYLEDVDAATRYLEEHSTERFVIPAPAFAEVLVGEGNGPDESDIEGAREALSWAEVYPVDGRPSPQRRSPTRSVRRGRTSPGWTP